MNSPAFRPEETFSVLRQYNPWWLGSPPGDLPSWHRAVFKELMNWVVKPPAPRAVLLSGARQIGKTTLLLQAVQALLAKHVHPSNILYVTFDHPLMKLLGLEGVLKLWSEFEPSLPGPQYLFLDEIQYTRDWQVWLKHQVDFKKDRRIIVTGSATPLIEEDQESGVGRWHTIKLPTLSFYEFLQIKKIPTPDLPRLGSLRELFKWSPAAFVRISGMVQPLVAPFHDYLMRGGFPQCALTPSVDLAQKLLREDIVDKVLKRDMTALFGVRRVLELEQTFLYLCLHDGGLFDVAGVSNNLQVAKPTVMNYITLLESTHLIHRLTKYGYGKDVLRAKYKVYLSDAAIAPSVLLKGKAMLEDDIILSRAVETAFFKHVFTRFYHQTISFSFWQNKNGEEVDIVADIGGQLVPFEIKYRRNKTNPTDMKGLISFCGEKKTPWGYAITRESSDFMIQSIPTDTLEVKIAKIPAVLACFWLGQSELSS